MRGIQKPLQAKKRHRFYSQSIPRHFIALTLPVEVTQSIQQLQRELRDPLESSRVRWVPATNLHITLKFFGSMLSLDSDLQKVKNIMDTIASSYHSFPVELKGIGVFPKWKKPRVLHISMSEGTSTSSIDLILLQGSDHLKILKPELKEN